MTIGKWRWLHRGGHSAWLSVSAGTALAYVFVYLLPKLALTQQKLTLIVSEYWTPLLHNQTYLLAMAGLVCFFWLGWLDSKLSHRDPERTARSSSMLVLHIGGYGVYSLQIGLLVAQLPQPDYLSYLLATTVLGLHLMGVNHGVRSSDPVSYDAVLRWVFTGSLVAGWAIGISTDKFDTLFMLLNSFIAGGIIITAIREELPSGQETHFLPFLLGTVCASAAILIVQSIQNPDAL